MACYSVNKVFRKQGDRTPLLESHGQALEQTVSSGTMVMRLPISRVSSLATLYGITGCLNGNGVEQVSFAQIGILFQLI